MKKYVIIVVVIGIILGFLTGLYLYKINQIKDNKQGLINQNENNVIEKIADENTNNLVITNNEEEKVSPNCVLVLKVYYNKCEHLIQNKKNIEEAEVNMTEQELRERFSDWEVQRFTPTEIVLYKEIDGFCDEHYLLKEKDGYIAVYKLDEKDEPALIETTDISTEYLTEQDLEEIKNGIKIFSKSELRKSTRGL